MRGPRAFEPASAHCEWAPHVVYTKQQDVKSRHIKAASLGGGEKSKRPTRGERARCYRSGCHPGWHGWPRTGCCTEPVRLAVILAAPAASADKVRCMQQRRDLPPSYAVGR